MRFCLLVFLSLALTIVNAQSIMDAKFQQLLEADTLPSTIRSGKTLVLMQVPNDNAQEFERVSKSFHKEVIRGGIDPVVYFNIDIIFSGVDVTRSFLLDLTQREIKNIVLLDYKGPSSRVAVMKFSAEFFSKGPVDAWIRTGELDRISNELFVRTANSGHELSNFLLPEIPEVGVLTRPIKGKRAEFFSLAGSRAKLAVPRFGSTLQDQELQAIMDLAYEHEFELVDPNLTDAEIQDMGFQLILRYINGPVESVRKLLEYEEEEGVTGHVTLRYLEDRSQAITQSLGDKTFKFYVKHFNSNTTHLGPEWDADNTWRQALLNHLRSFDKWTNR